MEVDVKKTVANVNRFARVDWPKIERFARLSSLRQSVLQDADTMQAGGYNHNIDKFDKAAHYAHYQKKVVLLLDAIEGDFKVIMTGTLAGNTNAEIYNAMNVSSRTFGKLAKRAKSAFAELYDDEFESWEDVDVLTKYQ